MLNNRKNIGNFYDACVSDLHFDSQNNNFHEVFAQKDI